MAIDLTKFTKVFDLLGDIPTNPVLRERVLLAKEQMEALRKEVEKLQAENTRLENRNAELEQQLASQASAAEFVEHRGALFKRRPGGGYHLAVYCPDCHKPTFSLESIAPYTCKCGWFADFTGKQLESVMRALPQ